MSAITLPDALKKINIGAFNNTAIPSIQLPDSLTYIGISAFAGCTRLETIDLPQKLSYMGDDAFHNCELLKQVVIPASVKELRGCFYSCNSLEKIELQKGVEDITWNAFNGCPNLKELHIPESVFAVWDDGDNKPPASCVIYGKSGSAAEEYADICGLTFVSEGASVLSVPVLSRKLIDGNCIRVTMDKRCYNAQFYDYVLSKDSKFPTSGKSLFRQNLSQELTQEFNQLDKGTYYVFARSGRTLKNGEKEYSAWSKPVKTVVSTQAPKTPTFKSVTVKGNTVTVVLNKTAGAAGYTCVLAYGANKNNCQKLVTPFTIKRTANSASTKLVFKNVKKTTYTVLARSYVKQKNGTKVSGKWRARTAKVQVK